MKKLMYSSAGLLLIALAFLAFNMVSGLALTNARLDLTEQKLYTISDGTRQILGELDEPINLYFFYSDKSAKDLVVLRNYARRVEEMLKAYAQAADGKIKLHIVDPEPFSEDEDKAAEFGLQAVPAQQGGDAIYFGLAGTNSVDDHQVIPFFPLDQEEFLEYEVSRLVQSLAHPQRPVVGVLSGLPLNGGFDMQTQQPSSPWMVMEEIRQLFQIESLKPDVDQIPDKVSVLLLVHPKNLPEQTQYAIDQFVLRGGKLLAFVDPLSLADADGGKSSDLAPLLRSWGVQLRPDTLLADASFAMIKPNAERRPERNPTWLHLPGDTFPHDNVLTTGLESLNLASVGLLEPLGGASTRFIPLLHSSAHSMPLSLERFRQSSTEQLNATLVPTGERYVLAAKVEGPATSAFPADRGKQGEGLSDSANIHVLLVADTDLLSNPLWLQEQPGHNEPQVWADNDLFVGNALDYLSGSDALIDLRSRGHTKRPFTRVEALRREAGLRAQEQLNALQQSLNDTDRNLRTLQQSMDAGDQEVTPEMEATLRRFIDDKLRIRQQLRQLQFQLNADVERLGEQVKLANTVLLPALLTLFLLLHWSWRSMRRRRG